MIDLHSFTFNGVSSRSFNAAVVNKEIYKGAARDVQIISAPGRHGDIIIDNGRYKNVKIMYEVAAQVYDYTDGTSEGRNLVNITQDLKAHLLANVGYYQLTDTYDPDFFRMAAYTEEFDMKQDSRFFGTAKITFNCKPHKYQVAGYQRQTHTEPFRLENPLPFDAEPYIKIYGSGDIVLRTVDANTLIETDYAFVNVDEYIEIDTADMVVFKGNTLQNHKFKGEKFPTLGVGVTYVTWTKGVTKTEIIPRWRCL